jgi:hypothetical protein
MMGEAGQNVAPEIAENILFLNLATFGLAAELFGERLLPIGTVILRSLRAVSMPSTMHGIKMRASCWSRHHLV